LVEFLALQVLMGNLTNEKIPTRYKDAVLARVAELSTAEVQS